MNCHAKKMLLAVSILALLTLLVSGCDGESQGELDRPPAQGAEVSPGAEFEPGSLVPAPEGEVIDVDQAGEAEQAAGVEEEVSAVDPENIPSGEQRNAILDQVNKGGPTLEGNDEEVDGPVPGTESGPGDE
jgi:hypothetical protein